MENDYCMRCKEIHKKDFILVWAGTRTAFFVCPKCGKRYMLFKEFGSFLGIKDEIDNLADIVEEEVLRRSKGK